MEFAGRESSLECARRSRIGSSGPRSAAFRRASTALRKARLKLAFSNKHRVCHGDDGETLVPLGTETRAARRASVSVSARAFFSPRRHYNHVASQLHAPVLMHRNLGTAAPATRTFAATFYAALLLEDLSKNFPRGFLLPSDRYYNDARELRLASAGCAHFSAGFSF